MVVVAGFTSGSGGFGERGIDDPLSIGGGGGGGSSWMAEREISPHFAVCSRTTMVYLTFNHIQ